jgi:hypothetical protein
VELPTYTNIWKIEKRLYKLYDFRLPMPLPVGQVAAFLAIAVPYTLILTMVGMPFSHTWLWVYVLPPGVLAWLVTRPVLEGKRLPELALSQLHYLSEPRTWCRMAPLAEQDEILLAGRVWRSARYVRPPAPEPPLMPVLPARHVPGVPAAGRPGQAQPVPVENVPVPVEAVPVHRGPVRREPVHPGPERPAARKPAGRQPATRPPTSAQPAPARPASAQPRPRPPAPAQTPPAPPAQPAPGRPAARQPVVVVRNAGGARPLNTVERALRSSPGVTGRLDQVVVMPGGHGPGRPDQVQRDQARARLPLPGPARVVVLGCTAGAGQTATTLLTGQLLASLRGEAVAVLDLASGSLTQQARSVPVLLPSRRAGATGADSRSGERGLQVVTADGDGDDAGEVISAVASRYRLTLADPDAARVPRALAAADQLVLVAPASAEAAGSLAMTMEWLEAHGHGRLAGAAITVLNGVSAQTAGHVDKAAAVAMGRCRAIVRVPWDERMTARQPLGTATVQAYTALAGVLVAGLADSIGPVDMASMGDTASAGGPSAQGVAR